MNVKVNRVALIEKLEKAAAVRSAELAEQEKHDAEYDKAKQKHQEDVAKAVKSGKAKITNVSVNWRNNSIATVEVELPPNLAKEVERKYVVKHNRHELDEILSAVALLKLSDETCVSASSYKNVAQYLA